MSRPIIVPALIIGTTCLLLLLLVVEPVNSISAKRIYGRRPAVPMPMAATAGGGGVDNDGPGEPLFLTPLINAGKIQMARQLALVTNLTEVVSYSGFLTVNPKFNSNMYFWFFPAAYNPEKAPLMIWLQGGPGGSSLFGLFVENGPFIIDSTNSVQFRNTAWTLTHSVIYFDNPVGTGFSFTDSDDGYARNEVDVARDLYNALQQFFTLFPEYQARDFYVTGESYAGKYVPAISYKIHTENLQPSPSKIHINLKGLAIGDGFSDPPNMLYYGEYLHSIGLLDENQMKHFQEEEDHARECIRKGEWLDAFKTIDALMDGDLTSPSYFKNVTGLDFYFNFLMSAQPADQGYYSPFLQQTPVRRAIHVGNVSYDDEDQKVETFLREDMYQSVKPWIEQLLDAPQSYKVLMYSGQLDIIVANTLTCRMLSKLNWSGAMEYSKAERKIWRVNNDVAGYVKKVKGLTYVLVRDAGHMIPYDQPKWAFDMINRFTAGKPFAS